LFRSLEVFQLRRNHVIQVLDSFTLFCNDSLVFFVKSRVLFNFYLFRFALSRGLFIGHDRHNDSFHFFIMLRLFLYIYLGGSFLNTNGLRSPISDFGATIVKRPISFSEGLSSFSFEMQIVRLYCVS